MSRDCVAGRLDFPLPTSFGGIIIKIRALCVLTAFCVLFAGLAFRTGRLSVTETAYAGNTSQGIRIDIADIRGTVYDCNMLPLTNAEYENCAAIKPSNEAAAALEKYITDDELARIKERMQNGKPATVMLGRQAVNCDSIKLISVPKRYSSAPLATHIIGYIDSTSHGVCGIEKAFDTLLFDGGKTVSARFPCDAAGRVLLGSEIKDINGGQIPKSGVVLTIDKRIQQVVEAAMDEFSIRKGAVVIIEVGTGAIRACAGRPVYSPDRPGDSLTSADSPFINRAFLPFSVGSAFKPVVAAAALENNIGQYFEYNCVGKITVNGVEFGCHEKEGHGMLDIKGAVTVSCNPYFIALAQKTDTKDILETASALGFGKKTTFAPGIESAAGYLPTANEIDSGAAKANLSFGQGTLMATPVQLASMMAGIADSGIYTKPYLIEGTTDDSGAFTQYGSRSKGVRAISEKTAKLLCGFLQNVVAAGSGKRAASAFFSAAGKTATAQTGVFINGEETYNAWFAGFFPANKPKYAMAILRENGGEGAVSCAPVFKKISEEMYKLGYLNSEQKQ